MGAKMSVEMLQKVPLVTMGQSVLKFLLALSSEHLSPRGVRMNLIIISTLELIHLEKLRCINLEFVGNEHYVR